MKLSYRMFLWIGTLFILCFIAEVLVEAYLTRRVLKEGEATIIQHINEAHAEKRERADQFLTETVAEKFAKIDTTLSSVASYPLVSRNFMGQESSWEAASDLFFSNKWIDLLEHFVDGKLGASMVVHKKALQITEIIARAQENSSIVKIRTNGEEKLAILIPIEMLKVPIPEENQKIANLFMVFNESQIPSLANIHFNTQGFEDVAPILQQAEQNIHQASGPLHWITQNRESSATITPNTANRTFEEEVDILMHRYDQVSLIRMLTHLISPELFGTSPFDAQFPVGLAIFQGNTMEGFMVYTDAVFLKEPYRKSQASATLSKTLAFQPSVIDDGNGTLFLTSQLSLNEGNTKSQLVLGISLNETMQLLSSAFDLPVFCSFQNQIFLHGSSYDDLLKDFPIQETIDKSDGIISLAGCKVFYIRIQPIPGIDLNFYVVNLASREFQFLDTFEQGSHEIVEEILKRMWINALIAVLIVLFILSRMAKKITDPISKLATAASAVGKGRLAAVDLPKISINRHDEVHALYVAFDEMLQSLKDKEKVRAALNKVVSPVIAAEILKSDMHLGGEKKEVCVLFGDIRGFTQMTEKMDPEAVIEMLNHCMTHVSRIVDENGGIIDKYVGDAAMALFGIPQLKEGQVLGAIKTAIEITKRLAEWNKEREAQGKIPIHMGIGIDVGDVVAGNMGAEDRQNYTVLGKHVNMASRLCAMAAPGQILISEAVANFPRIKETFTIREIGKEKLKGFTEEVAVYEVIIS